MTTIDRLGILGIRSYGAEEETFIKFFKPLTIILGRNGSGKSTIIEAVKMATTGDLPPNVEKGAAFIHDPRIDNETETKAKIRLMFSNIRGDQYIVARHFQLAIRTGPRGIGHKTEFKTLDQTLKRTDHTGSNAISSYRCADLNTLLPEVMRVTKPVLNNVIFVHQEDSLWPLGDSKKLKEKFDEIFAATRYTKALDTIRIYRRDQAAELRTVNAELVRYEDKVRILEKVRAEVDEIQVKCESLRKGEEKLSNDINDKKTLLQAAQSFFSKWQDKHNQLREKEIERTHIVKDNKERFRNLQLHLRETSDADIRTQIDDLTKTLDRADSERAKRSKLIEDLKTDIEMKREEYNRRLARRGKLEEQKGQNEERMERLEDMKKKFVDEHGHFGKELTEIGQNLVRPTMSSPLDVWTAAFNAMLKDAEKNVSIVNKAGEEEHSKVNATMTNVKLRLETCRENQKRKSKEREEKRAELINIRGELRSTEKSQTSISEAENKLKTAEEAFKKKSASNKIDQLKTSIMNDQREKTYVKEKRESNRTTRDELVRDHNDQARLEVSKEAVRSKKGKVECLMEDFLDLLSSSADSIISKDEDSSDLSALQRRLDKDINNRDASIETKRNLLFDASSRVLAKRDTILQTAEDSMQDAKTSFNSLSAQYNDLKKDFDKAKRELRRTDSELSSMKQRLNDSNIEISDISSSEDSNTLKTDLKVDELVELFQSVSISSGNTAATLKKEHMDAVGGCIARVEKAIVKESHNISTLETGVHIAENDLHQFEHDPKHKCPACGLSSSKRVGDMRNNLKTRVEYFKNPRNLATAEKRKKVAESTVSIVRKLHTQCTTALSTVEKFNSVTDRLKEVEQAKDRAQNEFNQANARVIDLQTSIGASTKVDQITARRVELKQALNDLDEVERDANRLQESVTAGTGETKTLAEVDERIRELEEEMQTLQEKIDRDSKSLDRERDELRRCETKVHLARAHFLELKTLSETFKRLQMEKENATKTISSAEVELQELRDTEQELKTELEDIEVVYMSVRTENRKNSEDASTICTNRRIEVQAWKDCCRKVDGYIRSGKRRDLEYIIKSLETIEDDIKTKSTDLKGHEDDEKTATDSKEEMAIRIRNLRDNQSYRLQEQAAQVLARDMRNLRAEIDELLKESGEEPLKKVSRLNKELNDLLTQLSATKGKKHVYDDSYRNKKVELQECEKQGSRRKFDECRIKKQTMELASQDLERYHRALDQALMAFHTLKMRSINRTIKELWQQTYRGTDIDEIEITSDHNDSRTDGTRLTRRNFNYRVLMRRGQATLDMRGRCSAGQKVLACLVIRLALAESFCMDCGILALDEPTTNLDRMNIESLATALRAIIETRRRQRNFQLVLITHDEEFIELLGARDFCSEYFKVFKNERQKSCAQIESLLEVGV